MSRLVSPMLLDRRPTIYGNSSGPIRWCSNTITTGLDGCWQLALWGRLIRLNPRSRSCGHARFGSGGISDLPQSIPERKRDCRGEFRFRFDGGCAPQLLRCQYPSIRLDRRPAHRTWGAHGQPSELRRGFTLWFSAQFRFQPQHRRERDDPKRRNPFLPCSHGGSGDASHTICRGWPWGWADGNRVERQRGRPAGTC